MNKWRIRLITGYYRLTLNDYIVATYSTKGAAKAGMVVEKRRLALRLARQSAEAEATR